MITAEQADDWIRRYADAWRAKDAEGVAELFSSEGVYQSSPTEPAARGRAEIKAYWRRATATQQELELRFGQPVIGGRRVAVEWWAVMRDPDWRADLASDLVTLPGCLLLAFDDDGRCASLREYYNPCFGRAVQPPSGWGA